MAKTETEEGEQLMLMDIHTKGARALLDKLTAYDKVKKQRIALSVKEVAMKNEILPLAHALDCKPDGEGVIKFIIENVEVEVVPSKETIKIKVKEE